MNFFERQYKMLLLEQRKKVIEIARRASDEKLVPLTFGNFSVRDKDTGYVCITPSGMPYHTLNPEDIVVVDVDGNIVDGQRRPSIETPLHTLIYKSRDDVFGVVHTHSTFLTAWSCLDGGMPCITSEAASLVGGKIECAPFEVQGTIELAEVTSKALKDGKAVLMANHGAIFADDDIDKAYKDAFIMEESAKVAYLAYTLGKPNLLSDQIMKTLKKETDEHYGQNIKE